MNILRKFSILIFAIIIASIPILLETNCTIKNPVESLKVKVDFSPVSTVISGQFVNTKTGTPISNKNTTLTIKGDSKDVIVDLLGEPKTEFIIDSGFLTFGIEEGIVPSKDDEISITLVVTAEGYIPTSKALLITDTKNVNFTIKMVEINDTPKGVIAKIDNNGQTDPTGKLTAELIVQTENEPETETTAGIKIEAGTIIKDANGNPLSGTLTTSIVYYNNQSDESLEAFPGGLNVLIEQDESGESSEGIFVSAGFIAVEIMDQAGNKAASFEPPIKISIEVPDTTINPVTKQPIQNGDEIPIWSYDTKTGKWSYEYMGTAGSSTSLARGNGKLSVTFPASHLSYWNMDWHFPGKCNSGTITVEGNPDQVHLDLKIRRRTGGGYMFSWNPDPTDPNHITILNAPPDFPVTIEAYYFGEKVGSLDVDNLCDYTGTFYVDLPQKSKIDINVTVNAFCAKYPDIEVKPTMPIYLRKLPSQQYQYYGYMKLGQITILGLEVGAEYQFMGVYEGNSADTTLTITNDMQNVDISLEIPEWICGETPGVSGPVYALASNDNGTIYVGGDFEQASNDLFVNGIAKWNGRRWSAFSEDLFPNSSPSVRALAFYSNNVYAGHKANNGIHYWTGTDWSTLSGGLNGNVNAITATTSNGIYVGGHFTTAGNINNVGNIIQWNGSGWNTLNTGVTGGLSANATAVNAIAVGTNDTVYVGGHFTKGENVDTTKSAKSYSTLKWHNSDWYPLNEGLKRDIGTALSFSDVYAVAVQNNNIYVGGRFTHFSSDSQAVGIAKWNGQSWSAVGIVEDHYKNTTLTIRAIAIAKNGDVFVGGNFHEIGGKSIKYIARWDGTDWHALDGTLNGSVYALYVKGNNVYVGGNFTKIDDVLVNYIARWNGNNWFPLIDE